MSNKQSSHANFYSSMGFMLISALALALVALFSKEIMQDYSLTVVLFLRFIGVSIILILLYIIFIRKPIRPESYWPYIIRAVCTFFSQTCYLYYVFHGTLLNATLLYSSSSIFIPIISFVIFRVKTTKLTVLAIVIGFIGLGVVLHPTHISDLLLLGIGLMSGFLVAISNVFLHKVSKNSDPIGNTLISYIMMAIFSLLVMLTFTYHDISPAIKVSVNTTALLFMLLLCLAIVIFQVFRAMAYGLVDNPAKVSPFQYTFIIYTVLLDWLLYNVELTWYGYAGIFLIIISSSIMSYQQLSTKHPTQL